ncbi:hypothetical protein [Burkholderia sp. JKS000303]|uniref:hypothetical protein n=1 Tax=Burkholderia sp. JKS000303 TaxID=1938747 RepID=UPI000C0158E4|nr:hypothetical protein [Burkholderia sp. JKS000303]PFH20971.1 hypothetical protein BX604_5396 [Burkholderia sp. JKS000303]
MTLVVSWTRATHTGRELWMMSDSRLSGGKIWDYGPKIFGVGRSDAIISFAGETDWTYPLIAQITSYIESFVNLRDRVLDVSDAYDLIINMLNESLKFVSDTNPVLPELSLPKCSFIFAGYSARLKDFFVRRIVFHPKRRKFESRPARKVAGEFITYIGDEEPLGAMVRHISENRKKYWGIEKKLDMLPAEAFYTILSSKKFRDIGGAPQISKVYQNMNQRHFGVYWPPELPHQKQDIFLRGHRLRKSDALDHPWVYDPEAARLFWHDFSPDTRRANSSVPEEINEFAITSTQPDPSIDIDSETSR